jgi:hypothetical protein
MGEPRALIRWGLRGLLALALITMLVIKHRSANERVVANEKFDAMSAVMEIVRENALDPTQGSGTVLSRRFVNFTAPACNQPSIILANDWNIDATPFLAAKIPAGYTTHVRYMDFTGSTQDRNAMFLEWLRQSAKSMLGLSQYVPVRLAIVISEPPDCSAAMAIDWRPLWHRSRVLGQAASGAKP